MLKLHVLMGGGLESGETGAGTPDGVQRAVHIVSLDEDRVTSTPTLINRAWSGTRAKAYAKWTWTTSSFTPWRPARCTSTADWSQRPEIRRREARARLSARCGASAVCARTCKPAPTHRNPTWWPCQPCQPRWTQRGTAPAPGLWRSSLNAFRNAPAAILPRGVLADSGRSCQMKEACLRRNRSGHVMGGD